MPVPKEIAPEQTHGFAEDISVVAPAGGVPTGADYAREHGTYRALVPLVVDGAVAVPVGGSAPCSHPHMRDRDGEPGWATQGVVELTGAYDAPADLAKQATAGETARRDAESK